MATPSIDSAAISFFLRRAVENVYPTADKLGEVLLSGKQISVYLGIDPTGPSLHMGHAIAIRKLVELQQLGHKVILLIGDFTAMIGDPTDKLAARTQLTRDEILANCKNYKEQASRLLKFDGPNPAELKFNSEWLAKMSFADVVELASHFTVQQMLERDMFRRRMSWRSFCPNCNHENYTSSESQETASDEAGKKILISSLNGATWQCKECKQSYVPENTSEIHSPRPVYLHEFLYPLMQGYDSVAMDVDLEVGGNDQTFNMLAGRTLMREMKHKEKFVLTCKLLTDSTGKKMGKTEGNIVALNDSPEEMYGKVMSWTDGMIIPGFELCTDVPDEEIRQMESQMEAGENPMQYKKRLAKEVVAAFLSQDAAEQAEKHFAQVHQQGEKPQDIPTYKLPAYAPTSLLAVLVESGIVSSKTDARRQVEQGGVKVDDQVVTDVDMMVNAGSVVQKGKRYFLKLT